MIRQLQEEGYQVEAVRNRGYHIVDSPDVMTKEELDSLIKTQWAGRNILYYDVTDSTNLRVNGQETKERLTVLSLWRTGRRRDADGGGERGYLGRHQYLYVCSAAP